MGHISVAGNMCLWLKQYGVVGRQKLPIAEITQNEGHHAVQDHSR